jgi:diguanylate cyclase (GGDEF)-like protein
VEPLQILSFETLVVAVPALMLSLGLGFWIGRSRVRELRRDCVDLQERLERAERRPRQDNANNNKIIAKMRRELDTVANLALALPHVVRDLNRDDIDPTDVPRLILQLADAIFKPQQILLYQFGPAGPGSKERVLLLKAQRGLDEVPESLKQISTGEGKIGWVAERELDMLRADWDNLKVTDLLDVMTNDPALLPDIIGPMIHQSTQRAHVMGVLCIGGPRIKPRDPKLMFQMVTNFGSMALVNTFNTKKLRSAAHTDGLTRLMNKRGFLEEAAAKTLVECEQSAKPFSIFIFDIDNFKNFNDTNGHPAGDALLRRMGDLIRHHLRPGDLACRYGGEEFVIAMPDTGRRMALELAEKFRELVQGTDFEHRESQPLGFVSISGGVAAFPKDGSGVAELVKRADEALYSSKKGGRNRVAAYKGVDIGDSPELTPVIDAIADADLGQGRTPVR